MMTTSRAPMTVRMLSDFCKKRISHVLPPRETERLRVYLVDLLTSGHYPPMRGTDPNWELIAVATELDPELLLAVRDVVRPRDTWTNQNPGADERAQSSAFEILDRTIDDELKILHATAPKYDFKEASQAEVIARYNVGVDALVAEYAEGATKGAQIVLGNEVISPEAFALRHYAELGWQGFELESVPFHALFGAMMWLVIQDAADPLSRMVGFGSRTVYEANSGKEMIWTLLPEDFGARGYAQRRKEAIDDHFETIVPDREQLLWLFDYWRNHSEDLRQYLWAHRPEQLDIARRVIEILPPATVVMILRYLIDDYWGHYLGWPDLLLYRGSEFRFVEVKSSSDRLSEDQKRWVADNHAFLKLPFSIAKIHRLAPGKIPRPH